jgi:toxin CcdB
MARFDVFSNPFAADRNHTPFVVDVQNDHLGPLATRVVIPLRTRAALPTSARGINPSLEVQGRELVLDTASLAPVPVTMLRKPVTRLDAARSDILDALDVLFGSF